MTVKYCYDTIDTKGGGNLGYENFSDVLTVKEIAEYLKVNTITVQRAIKKGDLKAFKLGKDWRIQKEDLINWINGKYQR